MTTFDLTKDQIKTICQMSIGFIGIRDFEIEYNDTVVLIKIKIEIYDVTKHYLYKISICSNLDVVVFYQYFNGVKYETQNMLETRCYNQRDIQLLFIKWGIYPSHKNIRRRLKPSFIKLPL